MTHEEMLNDIGLGRFALGPIEILPPPPPPDTAHGYVMRESSWSKVELPHLAATRFVLEESAFEPGRYRLWTTASALRQLPADVNGVSTVAGQTLITSAELAGAFVLLDGEDTGVAVFPPSAASRLQLCQIVLDPLVLPPALDVSAPISLAVDDLADPWLAELLRDRVAGGDAWDQVVAMGLLVRLWLPPQEALAASLGAAPDHPLLTRVQDWMASLPPEQHDAIARNAISDADLLADRLDELVAAPDPEDPSWAAAMLALLHERDALQGVQWLLARVGKARALDAGLAPLDAEGDLWLRSLPRWRFDDDEQLSRASLVDADAWWIIPLSWDDDALGAWLSESTP